MLYLHTISFAKNTKNEESKMFIYIYHDRSSNSMLKWRLTTTTMKPESHRYTAHSLSTTRISYQLVPEEDEENIYIYYLSLFPEGVEIYSPSSMTPSGREMNTFDEK